MEGGLSPNSSGKHESSARRLGLGCSRVFQHGNDPNTHQKWYKEWNNRTRSEELLKIQSEDDQKPVDGYRKDLIQLKKKEGHLTKY